MISATMVIFFVSALIVSFLCSLFEATLLSITPTHVGVLQERGSAAGTTLRKLKDRVEHPLIAILTLNTIANMFGAAGVGAEAAKLAEARGIPESIPVGIASGLLTLAILICGEIVPKTLGAVYWKQLAPFVALPIALLVTILFPIVKTLELIPTLISKGASTGDVSREEIAVLADAAGRLGTLKPHERQVIANLLTLSDVHASDALTPRMEMDTVSINETAGSVARDKPRMRHSRIPVVGEDIDDIKGIVLRHDILYACLNQQPDTPIKQLLKPIPVVPETATLAKLLERFSVQPGGLREQILLVVNEYGGTEGIITLEDVIETLLGIEILDETDLVADLRQLAERKAALRKRKLNMTE
ncbi:MAG: CNNM domain-containing protein [Phycisphaerales bacterium]